MHTFQLDTPFDTNTAKTPGLCLIILGDFNKANLSRELPKYRQHITCPTRDSNILDHCYTTINMYFTLSHGQLWALWSLFGSTYRQKLKSAKPVLRTVKKWTNEAEQDLKACFDFTDWRVFEAAANDLGRAHRDCNILYQFLWGLV